MNSTRLEAAYQAIRNKTVTVFGGNGFIGNNLVRKLVSLNAKVNVMHRSRVNNPISRVNYIQYVKGNDSRINLVVKNSDVIYHLAGNVPYRGKEYDEASLVEDVKLTLHICRLIKDNGVKNFVFISGWNVYGDNDKTPKDEGQEKSPVGLYGVSKHLSEEIIKCYFKYTDVKCSIIRLATVYGSNQNAIGLIPNIIRSAYSKEAMEIKDDAKRDYIFIDDAVDGLIRCYGRSGVYNLGGGRSYSPADVAEMLKGIFKESGIQLKIKLKKSKRKSDSLLSIEKAKRELGFTPRTGLEDGLRKSIFKINTFFFDLDGTLIDPFDRLYSIHKDLCNELGVDSLNKDAYITLKKENISENDIIGRISRNMTVRKRYLNLFYNLIESPEYIKLDTIDKLKIAGLEKLSCYGRLVLVTNRKSSEGLINQLTSFGILNYFDEILFSRGTGKEKVIAMCTYFDKNNSLIVGDSEEEIIASRKLGIPCVWISGGMRKIDFIHGYNPDFVTDEVKNIIDVAKILSYGKKHSL